MARDGWRVLRFWNNDVLTNTEGVLRQILAALAPTPTLPRAAARERGLKEGVALGLLNSCSA